MLPLVLAGCGDTGGEAHAGGSVTITAAAEPDSLDPAIATDPLVRSVHWIVYTPLLTYAHAEGDAGREIVPGLAEELPEVRDGGRVYELALRDDLRHSDGTPVAASDFEHTVKRVLKLGSTAREGLSVIVGADEYRAAPSARGDVSGIEADDDSGRITIELETADTSFRRLLASPALGLVPRGTPIRDLSRSPPPGTGPYAITKVEAEGAFTLERVERFPENEIPDVPTGHLDEIFVRVPPKARKRGQVTTPGQVDAARAIDHPIFGPDYTSWAPAP